MGIRKEGGEAFRYNRNESVEDWCGQACGTKGQR